MSEQSPANPTDPYRYQEQAALVGAANQEIEDQNERLGGVTVIEDPDFQRLAVQGLTEEQAHSITKRDEAAGAIPYEEIALESLAAERALPELHSQLGGMADREAKIRRSAAEVIRLAPRATDAAKELEQTMLSGLEAEAASLQQQIESAGAVIGAIALYGGQWPVPRAALGLVPVTETAEAPSVEPQSESQPPVSNPIAHEPAQVQPVEPVPAPPANTSAAARKAASAARAPKKAAASGKVSTATAEAPGIQSGVFSKEQADAVVGLLTQIIDYAVSKGAFRMEELRTELPVVQRMSKEEYDDFKYRFISLKQDIVTLMKSQGKNARWLEIGKARGMRHQLTVREDDTEQAAPAKRSRKSTAKRKD